MSVSVSRERADESATRVSKAGTETSGGSSHFISDGCGLLLVYPT